MLYLDCGYCNETMIVDVEGEGRVYTRTDIPTELMVEAAKDIITCDTCGATHRLMVKHFSLLELLTDGENKDEM